VAGWLAWLALALHLALGSVLPAEIGARLVAAAERPCEGDGRRPDHAREGVPAPAIVPLTAAVLAVLPPEGPRLAPPGTAIRLGRRRRARPAPAGRRRGRAQARAPPCRAAATAPMRRTRAP
jgi:hypothetical protein